MNNAEGIEVSAGGKANIPAVMICLTDGEIDKKIALTTWKAAGIDLDFFNIKRAKKPYKFKNGESVMPSPYFMPSELSIGEIGCYFSHYRVWNIALEKAWPYVLILEEDAQPADCFRTVIRHALEIKDPDAAVMLFHETSKKSRTLCTWKDGVRLAQSTRRGAFSSMGYILFRGALQKLVAHMSTCQMPVDHFYDYPFFTRVNSYTIKPYAVKNSKIYYSYLENERIQPSPNVLVKKSLTYRQFLGRIFIYLVMGSILSQRISGRLIDKGWDLRNILANEPERPKLYVVVIALDPDKYRESKYMAEWMKYGIQPKIFRAVDGRKHQPMLQPDEKLSFHGFQTRAIMGKYYKPQNTEIGCYLSHLKVWRWALKKGIERLLVIEEDILPCENIKEAIQTLDSLDYDVIHLLRSWYSKSIFHKQTATGFMTTQPIEDSWSTGCYMATELTMKRWVKKLSTMTMPVDHALHLSRQTCRLRTVELRPYPVVTDPSRQSLIEAERRKSHLLHSPNQYSRKAKRKQFKMRIEHAFWRALLGLSLKLRQPGDGSE